VSQRGASINTTTINYGFTIQYSLPYFKSHVSEISNDFVKHLIPITEAVFSTPIANATPGTWATTGIQPGVIFADTWQIALEAVIPVNGASGLGIGVVSELHFFLDDMFSDRPGKPLVTPILIGAK
jgi:hypothetical protein